MEIIIFKKMFIEDITGLLLFLAQMMSSSRST